MNKLIILFVVLYCSIGYSQQSAETYTVEMVDGLRYVHNKSALWGDNPRIVLEFVRQFGGLDTTDENYSFYGPMDVSVDSKGNVYIVDHLNYRIQKYDFEGIYVKTIGRQDTGHGKFILPGALYIDKNDKLYINDEPDVILVLGTDGQEIYRLHTNAVSPVRGETFCVLPFGDILLELYSEESLLSVYTPDVDEPKPIGNSNVFNEKPFNSYVKRIQFTVDDDRIYISFRHVEFIETYTTEGKQIFRAYRPVDFDTSLKLNPAGSTGLFYVTGNKVSQAIAVDNKKRIWVVTYKRLEREDEKAGIDYSYGRNEPDKIYSNTISDKPNLYGLDVFDDEGVLLMQIPIQHYCDVLKIFGDRLFVLDKYRNMAVYEYRIVEK